MKDKSEIFSVMLGDYDYEALMQIVRNSIEKNNKITIGYCTAHILNNAYKDQSLTAILNSFDHLHADGTGVFIASKILYGKDSLINKITGSDFYPYLFKEGIKNNWSFYFLGDTEETQNRIRTNLPLLNIKGMHPGDDIYDDDFKADINNKTINVLIVGLGTPLQESWVINNKDKIRANVIITVGDGIKIFAGTKIRGPVIIQRLGLEWVVRLLRNPVRMWKRYLIGIPQFTFRVILNKIKKAGDE